MNLLRRFNACKGDYEDYLRNGIWFLHLHDPPFFSCKCRECSYSRSPLTKHTRLADIDIVHAWDRFTTTVQNLRLKFGRDCIFLRNRLHLLGLAVALGKTRFYKELAELRVGVTKIPEILQELLPQISRRSLSGLTYQQWEVVLPYLQSSEPGLDKKFNLLIRKLMFLKTLAVRLSSGNPKMAQMIRKWITRVPLVRKKDTESDMMHPLHPSNYREIMREDRHLLSVFFPPSGEMICCSRW